MEVEKKVLERVRRKSLTYGQDADREVHSGEGGQRGERDNYKVDPDAIVEIYRDIVIPITKEVQVAYLLQRLGNLKVAFLGPKTSYR